MGRGNCCTFREHEGLFYVDKDFLDAYSRYIDEDDAWESRLKGELDFTELTDPAWGYDETESQYNLDAAISNFKSRIMARFKSFRPCDTWVKYREAHAILENSLFYIAVEDNEWSWAFELIQKEDPYDDHLSGLLAKHCQRYLDGIRDALFEDFESLGTYGCAWTHGTIHREDFRKSA